MVLTRKSVSLIVLAGKTNVQGQKRKCQYNLGKSSYANYRVIRQLSTGYIPYHDMSNVCLCTQTGR